MDVIKKIVSALTVFMILYILLTNKKAVKAGAVSTKDAVKDNAAQVKDRVEDKLKQHL